MTHQSIMNEKAILYDLGKLIGDTEPAHIKLSLTDM